MSTSQAPIDVGPLEVILYPHPLLRYAARPIRRVDTQLRTWIREMFELMYEHHGVGLAAPQVGLPLQLFVVNPTGTPEGGEELVFINPALQRPKGRDEAEEGCLSLPSVYANVARPASIELFAYDASGAEIQGVFDGYLGRILQHEFDHLQGTLLIDRISESSRVQLRKN